MTERLVYGNEMLDHYSWLVMMGTPTWDTGNFDPEHSKREETAYKEMCKFIGKTSLETVRYLWKKLGPEFPPTAAVRGIFYFHRHDKNGRILMRDTVFFPIDFAINSKSLSRKWIRTKQRKLEKEWESPEVSFAIDGQLVSKFELELLKLRYHEEGDSGELWFRNGTLSSRALSREKPEHFVAFADIDSHISDARLLAISSELGSPFWVIKTTRGYHLIFPIRFQTKAGPRDRDDEIRARIGLLRESGIDSYNLFEWQISGQQAIRVTKGENRDTVPTVYAVVWDENTIMKSPTT